MASSLRDGKRLKIKFGGQDRDGFAVPLALPVNFTVDDKSLATVVPGDDGAAYIVPVQPFRLGTVKVTGSVPGHAELGTLEYTINLVASDAAKLVGEIEVVDEAEIAAKTAALLANTPDAQSEPKADEPTTDKAAS